MTVNLTTLCNASRERQAKHYNLTTQFNLTRINVGPGDCCYARNNDDQGTCYGCTCYGTTNHCSAYDEGSSDIRTRDVIAHARADGAVL